MATKFDARDGFELAPTIAIDSALSRMALRSRGEGGSQPFTGGRLSLAILAPSRGKCLIEIPDDVFDVLEADGDANHLV